MPTPHFLLDVCQLDIHGRVQKKCSLARARLTCYIVSNKNMMIAFQRQVMHQFENMSMTIKPWPHSLAHPRAMVLGVRAGLDGAGW